MRKLLVIFLSALSLTVFAQQKQVAMLEPVAVAGDVKPIEKSMIRGEMTKAIASQDGYSAFTRVDIDQIMKEHNFQQSGMVDDETRKRIGAMQGVDFVCVTKITKEAGSYYLEATLVNIETGQISSPATQYGELQNGGFGNMRDVCSNLAIELVGGVPVEIKDAASAEQDFKKGYDYYMGQNGVAQNWETAVKYLKKSAEQGNSDAQFLLGFCYYQGHGVNKDYFAAVSWFQKSAEQGHAGAQALLGTCYLEGKGVGQDLYAAANYIRKSASQGYADAQLLLGRMYENGNGVNKDLDEALMWFGKAASQGNKEAKKKVEELSVKKNVYYIHFTNKRSSPRRLSINGEVIGTVDGYSSKKFSVSLSLQGTLKSVQTKDYMFNPTVETFTIQGVKATQTISISN